MFSSTVSRWYTLFGLPYESDDRLFMLGSGEETEEDFREASQHQTGHPWYRRVTRWLSKEWNEILQLTSSHLLITITHIIRNYTLPVVDEMSLSFLAKCWWIFDETTIATAIGSTVHWQSIWSKKRWLLRVGEDMGIINKQGLLLASYYIMMDSFVLVYFGITRKATCIVQVLVDINGIIIHHVCQSKQRQSSGSHVFGRVLYSSIFPAAWMGVSYRETILMWRSK
jgi:hypothetical protein